jgi:hypothetical protein
MPPCTENGATESSFGRKGAIVFQIVLLARAAAQAS